MTDHVNTQSPRRIDTADCAKLIRKALKAAFQGQKFSVRTSRYSGGSSIRVSYTDGPAPADVDKIVQQFAGATFDGMIDLKEYHNSDLDGETVSFGADFVFTEREYTDEAIAEVLVQLTAEYHVDAPSVEAFRKGETWNVSPMLNYDGAPYWSWQNIIQRTLADAKFGAFGADVDTRTQAQKDVAGWVGENNS